MLQRNLSIAMMITFLGCCAPALGLVQGYTDVSEFSNPVGDWYGMNWDYVFQTGAGTGVAVGHFSILTANHYSAGTTFTIDGDVFQVIGQFTPPADPGQTLPPDLKVLKVRNTTGTNPLPGYYDINTTPLADGQDVVLVGTGRTGTAYPTYYTIDQASPRVKRWGTNEHEEFIRRAVDGADANSTPDWSTMTSNMTFARSATDYEVGLADSDSGAGVFVNDNGDWKLTGLGLYVFTNGIAGRYNQMSAAYLPDYVDWLTSVTADAYPGDFSMDGSVTQADYTIWADNYGWTGAPGANPADGNKDGAVTHADYTIWADYYGQIDPHLALAFRESATVGAYAQIVPEPATAAMLCIGVLAMLRRRRA